MELLFISKLDNGNYLDDLFKVPAQPILQFYDLTLVPLNAGNDSQLPPPPVAERTSFHLAAEPQPQRDTVSVRRKSQPWDPDIAFRCSCFH